MSETIAVELTLDAVTQARADAILQQEGLTRSEALSILLTRTAEQGTFPLDRNTDPAYDAWVRARVQEALDDDRPFVSNEEANAHFLQRRSHLLRRAG